MNPQKVVNIEFIGLHPTVDIEVDHPSHVYYANGIAVSNSHAVSYAMNTYLSAYAKAHFPKVFFTAYLRHAKNKIKPLVEINSLVNDAKSMDIQVCIPNLQNMNTDFELIDDKIYFGLNNIKNVGESVLHKIQKTLQDTKTKLNKEPKEFSWLEFLIFVSQHINSAALKNMISVGTLSYMGLSRSSMIYDCDIYSQLSQREKSYCESIMLGCQCTDLQCLLEKLLTSGVGKNGGCANKNRVIKIQGLVESLKNPSYSLYDDPAVIAQWEQNLLGINISTSVIGSCSIDAANCTCKDFIDGEHRRVFWIPAEVKAVKVHKTKKGKGEDMAFVNIADMDASLDVVVFPEAWATYGSLCVEGNTIMCCGERSSNKQSLIVKTIYQI